VGAGETVGYGAAFTADRPLKAAIVAAGYADGLLRVGAPRAWAALEGARLPYLGRISMDLLALDAANAPNAAAGDFVQLLGPEVPVDEAAAWAGTIAYEILTRLGPRAERRYLGEA
jgi:alanine racemase